MKYKLIYGTFVTKDRTYHAGDTLESDDDLAVLHPRKFTVEGRSREEAANKSPFELEAIPVPVEGAPPKAEEHLHDTGPGTLPTRPKVAEAPTEEPTTEEPKHVRSHHAHPSHPTHGSHGGHGHKK